MLEQVVLGEKSGVALRSDLVIQGRAKELKEMDDHFVYVWVDPRDYAGVKVEKSRWIDDYKGDIVLSRLVVQQYNDGYRPDTFAGTPPLGRPGRCCRWRRASSPAASARFASSTRVWPSSTRLSRRRSWCSRQRA